MKESKSFLLILGLPWAFVPSISQERKKKPFKPHTHPLFEKSTSSDRGRARSDVSAFDVTALRQEVTQPARFLEPAQRRHLDIEFRENKRHEPGIFAKTKLFLAPRVNKSREGIAYRARFTRLSFKLFAIAFTFRAPREFILSRSLLIYDQLSRRERETETWQRLSEDKCTYHR